MSEIKTEKPKLTERQELFCIEYVLNKGNASEAARRAGYSEATDSEQGCRLLRNVNIIARIAELREQADVKTGANVEWLTSVLVSAIERCSQKEAVYDSEGNETGVYKFDSKGLASNATVLMKLMGWDVKTPKPEGEAPVKIVAVEGFTGWPKVEPAN